MIEFFPLPCIRIFSLKQRQETDMNHNCNDKDTY